MTSKLLEFFAKFIDNAHLGKIATDLAPGIVLTTALLLLIGTYTDLEVFPYVWRAEYARQSARAANARRESERLLEALQAKLDDRACRLENREFKDDVVGRALNTELCQLLKLVERVRIRHAETVAEAKSMAAKAEEANQLKANLEIVSDHFISLFIAGYILGVVLAQTAGGLFYNGIFYRRFKSKHNVKWAILYGDDQRTIKYYKAQITNEAFLKRLPNLESDYYRYLEVAMNMILPFAVMAIALIFVGVKFAVVRFSSTTEAFGLLPGTSVASITFPFALAGVSFIIMVLLFKNAEEQYHGYFILKADVKTLLEAELLRQPAQPPIPAMPPAAEVAGPAAPNAAGADPAPGGLRE
jgi:hypothetical protein